MTTSAYTLIKKKKTLQPITTPSPLRYCACMTNYRSAKANVRLILLQTLPSTQTNPELLF